MATARTARSATLSAALMRVLRAVERTTLLPETGKPKICSTHSELKGILCIYYTVVFSLCYRTCLLIIRIRALRERCDIVPGIKCLPIVHTLIF